MKHILTYIIILLPLISYSTKIDTIPSITNFGIVDNQWDDLDYGDPTLNIPFINIPNAISTGTANMSFPIDLPEGRLGVQPSLEINYDSEGGQTWLGTSWNVGISSISLDTRWGVPRFSNNLESEIYLLDGEQMGPVFHREAEYEREAERTFFLRQNINFQKIIRHGNNPSNYWWEVTEKDGTRHSYGGQTDVGLSSDHIFQSSDGIVEWYLLETREPNGNFISYSYQLIDGDKGREMYPHLIHYTGHKTIEGNYKVEFKIRETNRNDISVSGRFGFLRSQESLLDEIEVSYKDQLIRSYQFSYQLGVFEKTLLNSIQTFDKNNELFYEYTFEYYNDLFEDSSIKSFSEEIEWDVQKDNLDIGSVAGNVDGFNGKPTILGSANSESQGLNTSITVGFVAPPTTKDFTVGPNGGIVNNNSEGITALVDIDGDGLVDKVWRESSSIYYRSNLLRSTGETSFGEKIKLDGISSFNSSNTFAWNIGAELNVPPVYAGYTHEESTTRTTSYFVDFNGDELMDIVQEGEVYFNHLENGIPTFTKFPSDTPSPIYKGEGLDPDIITFDASQLAELQEQSPLHDVVRVWKAPRAGSINIDAPVQLIEDTSPASTNYLTKDGVRVGVQINNLEYYETTISENDFSIKTPSLQNIQINKGDNIYFRVGSIDDGSYDKVYWDPTITYLGMPFPENHPDEFDNNIYNASDDFLLSEKKSLTLIADGEIHIIYDLIKPILSDSIRIRVRGDYQYDWTIAPNVSLDTSIITDTIHVSVGDLVNFQIESQSNVDWPSIQWTPRVEYVSFDDGSSTTNTNGDPVFSECGTIEMKGYFNAEEWEEIVVIDSGQARLNIHGNFGSNKTVVIKHKNNPSLIQHFNITGNEFDEIINTDINDSIYVSIFYNDPNNNKSIDIDSATIELDGIIQNISCGIYESGKREQGLYGPLYRGWGQFIYDGNDGRSESPILFSELEIDTTESAQDTTVVDENSGSTEIEGTGGTKEVITIMTSDPKLLAWRGSDVFAFVSKDKQGSSRSGQKYIGPPTSMSGDEFNSPPLLTRFVSNGGFGGLGVPGTSIAGSAGYTSAKTWSQLDVTDFNGDRYPDIISETTIQYTNMRGGLSSDKYANNWGIHEAFSEAYSLGLGLNPGSTSAKNSGGSLGTGSNKSTTRVRQKARGNAGKARSSFESATESVGLSASFGSDKDSTSHTFFDINGDALEDKIWENGDVALNLGYTFAPKESWGFSSIRAGDAIDIGGGLGINISNGSYLGGISVTKTTNGSKKGFMDLNGDALLDMIVSVDPLMVRFNTGSNFTPPIEWLNIKQFDESQAIGESINAGFVIPIIFFFIKVVINIQGFIGQGSATAYDAFLDINGDGFPDYLTAKNDDANLTASYSNIGRTNLLKQVNYPLGANMVIDYETTGNSTNMPFSKWVMKDVVIYDGVTGDGSDFQQRSYSYENGFYDRHERQFLGFEKVIQSDMSGDNPERTIEQSFYVDNYYQKGLLKKATLLNKNQLVYKTIEQQYTLRDIETETVLPANFILRDDIAVFPMLSSKTIRNSEGNNNTNVHQSFSFKYDLYGNITSEIETDHSNFFRTIEYTYNYINPLNILDKKATEKISDANSILRNTSFTYDALGNNTEINQTINASNSAKTTIDYNEFGLVTSIQRPANTNNERLTYDFEYDSEDHQFQILEKDNYNYQKNYEYEPLFGSLIKYIDENLLEWNYSVDAKGRRTSVLNPRGLLLNHEYSKKYDYHINSDVAFATCNHINTNNYSDIISFQFSDGLHRLVQSKIPRVVNSNEELIVSGTSVFDSLGRVIEQYQEISEPLNNGTIINGDLSSVNSIIYEYDLNDRIIKQTNIDNGEYTFTYDISVVNNTNYLRKKSTNPLGLITESIFDARGLLSVIKENTTNEAYLTLYNYDGFNQLINLIHPNLSESNYTYDLLGRRINIVTPESGKTELKYDAAGNLIEKITTNIREGLSQNAAIRYTYDKERLTSINYPKNFQNQVKIHYGSHDSEFNRAGRIYLIEDATGGREYFYDEFGNPTKTIQTVLLNRSKIYTYVSAYEYDFLNRISKLYYPDGEELNYLYNKTGQLQSAFGIKGDDKYHYVDNIEYNKYGDQVGIEYGNQISNSWNYDSKRRITGQKINQSGISLINARYEYDKLDNQLVYLNDANSSEHIGLFEINKSYDSYSRLANSEGVFDAVDLSTIYASTFEYQTRNQLAIKTQSHQIDNISQDLTTRFLDYQYENQELLLRPSQVGGREYNYDHNGNISLVSSQAIFDFDQYIYDEENRLIGSSNNGKISLYSYDAFSRRVIKSEGGYQGIFINGAPAGWLEHKDDFQIDLNPYFTAYDHDYRKHIYINGERIVSKIGTGVFQSNLSSTPWITAGSLDYKNRITQLEQQILDFYASQGLAPGPPTLLAYYSQPEYNTIGFGDVNTGNPYSVPPTNWPSIAPPDSMGPPGSPIFYDFESYTNENIVPGYNFTSGQITKELEQFFYHYDAEENVNLVTGSDGVPRQFMLYFPGGEKWIDKSETLDKTNYAYQGILYDDHSQLYNFGETFYNPITGLNLSLDKYEQTFGARDLESFGDGKLFYDFAEIDESIAFDPEIINSEKPNSINANKAKIVNQKDPRKNKDESDKNKHRKVEVHPDNSPALVEQIADLMHALETAELQNTQGFNGKEKGAYKKISKQDKNDRLRKNKLKARKKNNKRNVKFRVK